MQHHTHNIPLHFLHPTSTIRLLVPRPRTRSTKLLRLTPPIISHQQRLIITRELLLQLVLRRLIHIFLVVPNNRFGDCLADGVDLGCVATAGDSDADINVGEGFETGLEDGFVDLRRRVNEWGIV